MKTDARCGVKFQIKETWYDFGIEKWLKTGCVYVCTFKIYAYLVNVFKETCDRIIKS